MTPSQSKINTSTLSSNSVCGSVSFETLACKRGLVVEENERIVAAAPFLWREVVVGTAWAAPRGANADTERAVANKEKVKLEKRMIFFQKSRLMGIIMMHRKIVACRVYYYSI